VVATIRPRRLGLLAGVGVVVLLALAGPVSAADPPAEANITGPCTLAATSTDEAGADLDTLAGPGTSDPNNPFDVDRKGSVAWSGTGPAITSGTFSVTVYGVPVWSGDIDNPDGKTSADGTLDLAEILSVVPIDLVGVVEVSGSVSGTGGSCSGSAWVRIGGDPLTSIPGLVGLGAAILGLVGVLSAVPGRHPGRGLIFGILLGLGAGVLTLVFGIVPLGSLSPVVAIVGGGLIGLVAGLLPVGGGAAAA
jgi:hypothetical protein